MSKRQKPEGKEWERLVTIYPDYNHEEKLRLARGYGVTLDTLKHWVSEGSTRKQVKEETMKDFSDPNLSGAIREVLAIPTRTKLDFVSFDIETSDLKADFSALLSAVIKPYGQEGIVFRADSYPNWQEGRRAEDLEICRDITNELAQHAIVITHYGCLTPEHKVLTINLQWKPVVTLNVGDKLIGFEEEPLSVGHHRRLLESSVVSTGTDVREVWEIILSDGTQLKATPDHRWLLPIVLPNSWNGYHWKRTDELKIGDIFNRIFPVWQEVDWYESGYLSGILDGEGSLSQHDCERGNCIDIRISQNEGLVLEQTKLFLTRLNFKYTYADIRNKTCKVLTLLGGRSEALRLLGSIRPTRLLSKLDVNKLGSIKQMQEKQPITVVGLRKLEKDIVVTLGTSTGTYIAEGFLTHNTGFDLRYTRAKMMRHGLPALPPMFAVDTYYLAKANMMISRRRLDTICKYLSLGLKSVVEGATWVEAALNGSSEALDEIVAHNIQDCILLEKVATVMFPYMRSIKRL